MLFSERCQHTCNFYTVSQTDAAMSSLTHLIISLIPYLVWIQIYMKRPYRTVSGEKVFCTTTPFHFSCLHTGTHRKLIKFSKYTHTQNHRQENTMEQRHNILKGKMHSSGKVATTIHIYKKCT